MEVESERVTIRLPKDALDLVDAYVDAGEHSNRSEVIRRAVLEYCTTHARFLTERVAAREAAKQALASIHSAREQSTRLDEAVEKLAKR